jgi:hypothetical protein
MPAVGELGTLQTSSSHGGPLVNLAGLYLKLAPTGV